MPKNETPLAAQRLQTPNGSELSVRSRAFDRAESIPLRYSEYGDGISPDLQWTPVENARSYAVIMEDPDAPSGVFVHWVAWNIPGSSTQLPEGIPKQLRPADPGGVLQGATSRGTIGYFGPRPPTGDPPHHYHFQVFALDTQPQLQPGATRDQLLNAISGHVIAKGELVGTFQASG